MDENYIKHAKLSELRELASRLELKGVSALSKEKLAERVLNELKDFEKFKKKEESKYRRIRQLGDEGKEGTTYLVINNETNRRYAMKQFRASKSIDKMIREAELQQIGYENGISPGVVDVNNHYRYIVMEKMDKSLFEVLRENKGDLSEDYQEQLIKIFRKLDEIKIFHADPNPSNFMIRGRKLFIIDYGFAKKIDRRLITKHGIDNLNMHFMVLGFLLKIKEICGKVALYKHKKLVKYLTEQQRELFKK